MGLNVLYLVIDSLRADVINSKTAPNLAKLADENCFFEDCIAPADWSLPSHASIFTGESPHEHHCYWREQRMKSLPLVESFNQKGFDTIGLTSNIYFSMSQGFGNSFDEFYETRRRLNPRGLNPFSSVRRHEPLDGPDMHTYATAFRKALQHDHPLASIENYIRAVGIELNDRYTLRDRIPGLSTDTYGDLTAASKRTEQHLTEVFSQHNDRETPFFAFANLMDAHFPYEPPEDHLLAVTDGQYGREDITDIEPDLSNPRMFLDQYFEDDIDEDDLELVRAAYRGEVHSVDELVGRLLDELERTGIQNETLIIVTSDHGEALGEEDIRGERSMGHINSVNEHHMRVPLIIANPEIRPEIVEQRVSLTALTDQLRSGSASFVNATEDSLGDALTTDEPVLFELPANPFHQDSFDRFENIPDWFVTRQSVTHSVVGFDGPWTVIAYSNGDIDIWRDDVVQTREDAPNHLVQSCEDAVQSFPAEDTSNAGGGDLSQSRQQQLEDLGYL